MSYSGPFINSIFRTDIESDEPVGISIQGANTDNRVTISYNGSGIHDVIKGPTPMVVFSHTYNRSEAGILLSVTNRINLSGKIYDRAATESKFSDIVSGEKALNDLFRNCPVGELEIKCGSSTVLKASGVRALSISTEPSPDAMTKSLGYNVDLEYYEKASGINQFITSCSDSWSIEPLEEYFYQNFFFSSTLSLFTKLWANKSNKSNKSHSIRLCERTIQKNESTHCEQ
jgi:hypothetical protein